MEEKDKTKNRFYSAAAGNRNLVSGMKVGRLNAEAKLHEQLLDNTSNFRVYKGIKKFIVLQIKSGGKG